MSYFLLFSFFLISGYWLYFHAIRIVSVRQALIVLSRVTDRAVQVVGGPKTTLIWPWQKAHPLDLTLQSLHLNIANAVSSDLAVVANLDIFYAFDAELLKTADLDRILPSLTKTGKIVNSWSDYILRSLVARCSTSDLLTSPTCRSRLEKQLIHTLQDRIQHFGLRVFIVRLMCQPTPDMLQAQLTAERMNLESQARSQALKRLAAALGPDHDLTQILSLDLLQAAHMSDSHLLTTVNLPVVEPLRPIPKGLRRKKEVIGA